MEGRMYPRLHDRLFLTVRRCRRLWRAWRYYLVVAAFVKQRIIGRLICLIRGRHEWIVFKTEGLRVCERCDQLRE